MYFIEHFKTSFLFSLIHENLNQLNYRASGRCENLGVPEMIQGLLKEQVLFLYMAKSAPPAPLVPSALH